METRLKMHNLFFMTETCLACCKIKFQTIYGKSYLLH